MTNHPITPPPELVQQWWEEADQYQDDPKTYFDYVATEAAQWGADQELEACIDWISVWHGLEHPELLIELLRAARRPEPSSLKEQATFAAAVLQSPDETCSIAEIAQHWHTIRAALEALPND